MKTQISPRAPAPETDCLVVAGEHTRRRDPSATGGSRESVATAVGVSDVPLPPPICRRASCHAASPLSLSSGTATSPPAPGLSVDEFNEMFFAEYGCDLTSLFFTEEEVRVLMLEYEAEKAYLLSHGEVQETAPAEDETQAAPPPPLAPDAPRPSKKRKTASSPPREEAENVEVQTPPQPLPPVPDATRPSKKGFGKKTKEAERPPWEADQNAEVQPPDHKEMASRILYRQFTTPEPSQGVTILSCQCREFPRGSPGCALHQAAPFRSWMSEQGFVPPVGGAGWAQVPKLSVDCGRHMFQRYARWRRRVWMPSRFFLERAQPPRT